MSELVSGGIRSMRTVAVHYLCLAVLALITLMPIWVMISTGFKNDVLVQQKEPVWFFFSRRSTTTNTS